MCEWVDTCPSTGKKIGLAPCKIWILEAFEVTPQDRVQRILETWIITEEDVLILSKEWLRSCDILKLRTLWLLKAV